MIPKLSVIIPVYNTEQYFDRCIKSVLNQGWANLEIIVVDDCSPGNIVDIVSSYQKEYDNIKLLSHDENKGLFQARLTGLKAFTGDYFAFLDSDDWVGVDFYRALMEKVITNDADIVTGDHLEVMERDNSYFAPHSMLSQIDWDLHGEEPLQHLMAQRGLDYGWWVIWNKIYSRTLWEKSRSVLESFETPHLIMCEDVAFSVNFFTHAQHLVSTHHYYYHYYRSQNSSTLQSRTFSQYQKVLADIRLSFDIARNALQDCNKSSVYESDWYQWRNSVLECWQNTLRNDSHLLPHQKRDIQRILDDLIQNPEREPCNLNQAFCGSGSFHKENFYEDIRKALIAPNIKVVSFDCFDTLVARPFFEPTDLFHLLDVFVNEKVNPVDYCVFTNIRTTAERQAHERKHLENPSWEDVTLDEIYSEVASLCPALVPYIQDIKAKEIELEIKYCNVRQTGMELLKCALAHGKKVICTSDMYLPAEVIQKILAKNGYSDKIQKLYLSCEIGLTKSSGNLYRHVLQREGLSSIPSSLMHIGDNWDSDVTSARKQHLTAYHLPKAIDLFKNANPGIYSGGAYYPIFCAQNGIYSGYSITEFWGLRCMMAVVANKLFDNPFVFYIPDSDFNNDSYTIGYFSLGMYTYAITDWLIHECQENHYDHLCFMARDGFLPLRAFSALSKIYHLETKPHYTYLSRKAILPLMISCESDFYSLYNNFNLSTLTPHSFLKISTPIIHTEKLDDAQSILNSNGISYKRPFNSIECFMQFGKVFFAEFHDAAKSEQYRNDFSAYFNEYFSGKSATFDVGYTARCESVLAQSFHYDITAHYVHTNNDRCIGRALHSGIKVKTMYPSSPFITGFIREQLMSEIAPSCLGYRTENGKFGPYFEDVSFNLQTTFMTHTMQNAALDFVNDMIRLFGEDLQYLAYRPYDACMPMEYYFNLSKESDRTIFRGVLFEDDMGEGNHLNMYDLWQRESSRWGAISHGGINYAQYPLLKRWCIIMLTDWSFAKKRCYDVLTDRHPLVLKLLVKTYHCGKKVYRTIKHR